MRNSIILSGLISLLSLLAVSACYSLSDDLEITGEGRLRLRFVDSARKSPLEGTYGEQLTRGFFQRHRFILEVAYPVTPSIRLGGKLRVSNEDEEILEFGPEYLSSQFGSAFIAYETPSVASRLGYFDLSYTPLSLMRWDTKDDPEGGGGGCAVCGAPGVAGAILGESLEEVGPTLTFEGLRLDLSPREAVDLSGFFTKSTIAGETYPVLAYGGKIKLSRYLSRTSSFAEVSALALRSEEDERSQEASGPTLERPFRNTVYGLAWRIPVNRRITIEGEWTQTESHDQSDRPADIEGYGGLLSVSGNIDRRVNIDASYIYLSPNWDSYFKALSYSNNRRGLRVRVEYNQPNLLIALFAKYLTTIAKVRSLPTGPGETIAYPMLSARGYLRLSPQLTLGLASIYSGEGIEEAELTLDTDTKRITWLAALTFEFSKDSSVTLEERYVQHRFEGEGDYDVSMLSLYVKAAIW